VTNSVDDSVTVHILPNTPDEKRCSRIRPRILVVAIRRARRTVAVLVVRAAVDPIAVLVDTVAHDLLGLRRNGGILVVAVCGRGVAVAIRIAIVDAVTLFVPLRVVVVTISGRRSSVRRIAPSSVRSSPTHATSAKHRR
jgi:hypothetical protein